MADWLSAYADVDRDGIVIEPASALDVEGSRGAEIDPARVEGQPTGLQHMRIARKTIELEIEREQGCIADGRVGIGPVGLRIMREQRIAPGRAGFEAAHEAPRPQRLTQCRPPNCA